MKSGTQQSAKRLNRRMLSAVVALSLAWTSATTAQMLTLPLWQDGFVNTYAWSTGEPVNSPVFTGTASMKTGLDVSAGFSTTAYVFARILRVNSVPYTHLEFYIHGGTQGDQKYRIAGLKTTQGVDSISGLTQLSPYLFDLNDQPITAVPAQAWAKAKIPLAAIGFSSKEMLMAVVLSGGTTDILQQDVAQPTAYIDEVRLTGPVASNTAAVSVDLTKVTAAPYSSTLPGVNLGSWALESDNGDRVNANNQMNEAGLKSFRAHFSNAAGNYDIGAWDFTDDDNKGNSITSFGNIIAGVPNASAFTSYNQWLGSPQQAAALLAYCNISTTDPAYLNNISIGSATEWHLTNPAIGGTTSPDFSIRTRDWKNVRFWVDLRRASPLPTDDGYNHLRIARDQPWRFTYWELGNEPAKNSALNNVPDRHDAEKCALRFVADWNLMKSIDPDIKLGISVVPDNVSAGSPRVTVDNPNTPEVESYTGWTPVLLRTLSNQGILPDWFSDHMYLDSTSNAEALTASLMKGDFNFTHRAATYRKFIDDYFGNFSSAARSGVEIHATEINNPTNDYRFTTSLAAGLLLGDSIGRIMQTEYRSHHWFAWKSGIRHLADPGDPYAGSSGWRDYGDWGMLGNTSSDERASYFNGVKFPTFFASKLIKLFAQDGDQVIGADGIVNNNIYLATYVVKKPNGNVSLLVINKSQLSPIQATFAFTGFAPDSAATLHQFGLTQDIAQQSDTEATGNTVDLIQSSASAESGTWTLSFPPFSMTVLQMSPAPSSP